MLQPGTKAPAFSTLAHTGETVRLEDHRGKYVLLWFYPVASTPG